MVRHAFREFEANVNRITCIIQNPETWQPPHDHPHIPKKLYYDCNIWISDKKDQEKLESILWDKKKPFITNNYEVIDMEGLDTDFQSFSSQSINLGRFRKPVHCKSEMKLDKYQQMKRTLTCGL